jgi:tRNA pseudouridine32 synthase / 23S rRNA pseudouridine746 synthase
VTRVELTPVTGRTHQLRLHMQAIGHPILGDDLYAHSEALAMSPRCLLHARSLAFQHPATGELMSFELEPEF